MKKLFLSVLLLAVTTSALFAQGEIVVRQDIARNAPKDFRFKLAPNQAVGAGEKNFHPMAVNVPMCFHYQVTAAQLVAIGAATSGNVLLTTLPAKAIVQNVTIKHATAVRGTAVAATGTLTSDTTAPSNGDTVTLGSQTYTYKTSLTPAANEVLIGASAAAALTNLASAINAGSGSGTTYGAGTTANTSVTAGTATSTTIPITAKTAGTAGNSIASTETSSHLSFGGATLSGGLASGITAATARVTTANTNYGSGTFDVYQAVGNSTLQFSATATSENFAATTAANLSMTSTGANLSTVTAGVIDVWLTYIVRP